MTKTDKLQCIALGVPFNKSCFKMEIWNWS